MITVAHVITSLKRGGAEEVLCTLVENLDPMCISSHVIYFHSGLHVARLHKLGVTLHHIRGFFCVYDPFFWYQLIRTLLIIKPDCIHALLWSSNIACRIIGYLLHIPVITVYHNQITLMNRIRTIFDKYTIQYATHVVAVSTTVARSIQINYPFISPVNIIIIPNGINTDVLAVHQRKKLIHKTSLQIPETAWVIGTVGRLNPIKKHALLLKAYSLLYKQYPNTYLLFIGDGPEQNSLTKLAQQMDLHSNVIFVTEAQAYGYYHLFDCFVLPSEQEGMSMALLEAQYYQCPCVIAHDSMIHDIIIHDYNGLIVQPNNPDELARTIIRILTDLSLKKRLAQQAHTTVSIQFTKKKMVEKYEHLFKRSINS